VLARVGAKNGMGVMHRDRRADSDRPGRRRRRRWVGVLLVLAGLAAMPAILLPRFGATPTAGPPRGRPAAATPSTSDRAALLPWGLLYEAPAATGAPSWDIWVTNPDGSGRRNLTRDRASDRDPDWSPDGRRIVYASSPSRCRGFGCQTDLYAIGRDGRHRRRLTSTPQDELEPDWSPDGGRIAYTRSVEAGGVFRARSQFRVWVMGADGGGQRQLTDDPGLDPDWAPDGSRLLYLRDGSNSRPLYIINGDGTGRRRLWLGNLNKVRSAEWSPDGTRIALVARDSVWVVNADGGGLRRIRQSASDAFWTPDGRHLVFTGYGSGATPPGLRRIDVDGRNEIALRP
jgi:Tol biopolymer transport system component